MLLLIASIAKKRMVLIESFTVSVETPAGAATAALVTTRAERAARRE